MNGAGKERLGGSLCFCPTIPKPGTEQRVAQLNRESPGFPASWHCHVWCQSFHPTFGARAWGQNEVGARHRAQAGSAGAACRGRAASACCPHSQLARPAPAATALALRWALPGQLETNFPPPFTSSTHYNCLSSAATTGTLAVLRSGPCIRCAGCPTVLNFECNVGYN